MTSKTKKVNAKKAAGKVSKTAKAAKPAKAAKLAKAPKLAKKAAVKIDKKAAQKQVKEKPLTKAELKKIAAAQAKAATLEAKQKKTAVEVKGPVAAAPIAAKAPKKGRGGKPWVDPATICREVACELQITTKGFCRLHYIKNWKRIQRKELILKEKKLNHYIEELVSKYPDKYIEAIRQDLSTDKDFAKVIADLEIEEDIDDFVEAEAEATENIIETIRGGSFDDGGDDDIF